jgi:hypothetical protein
VPQFLKLTDNYPNDPAAEEATIWIIDNDTSTYPRSLSVKRAFKLVQERYLTSKNLEPVCIGLDMDRTDFSRKLLRQIMAKNPNRDVQAIACLCLFHSLKETAVSQPENRIEMKQLLALAIKDYSDCPMLKTGHTVGEYAKNAQFTMDNLSVGSPAAEIVGTDAFGHALKLSDHLGKVAIVNFFGDW